MPKRNQQSTAVPLGPADVAISGAAKKHLENTIQQIATGILAAGVRAVNVPVGQANAVKEAFSAAGWDVSIYKCNGLLAEIRFRGPDDPPVDAQDQVNQ
jgi:hypothetical protein